MLSDAELVQRLDRGEDDAWATFVRTYQRKIWHVAYQFTGRADEAEELTQEIFIHLLKVLPSFDSSGSLSAWIQRVARNYAIDDYRRRRRERSLVRSGEAFDGAVRTAVDHSEAADPHRPLEQEALRSWLRESIDRLPVELGQAVILRDLQGMSYEEMAKHLGVPLGTVKSRINRGRIELARRLKRRRDPWDPGDARPAGGAP